MGVHGADKNAVTENRDATIYLPATNVDAVWELAPVTPILAPGGGVERHHVAGRLGEVHDAISHERRGFDHQGRRHLIDPLDLKPGGGLARDLVQAAIAPAAVRPPIG